MTRIGVCITLLLLADCTPGTDIMYGSSIGGHRGIPSITTVAVGRVSSQPSAPRPQGVTNLRPVRHERRASQRAVSECCCRAGRGGRKLTVVGPRADLLRAGLHRPVVTKISFGPSRMPSTG
jgi:hypothetical protein